MSCDVAVANGWGWPVACMCSNIMIKNDIVQDWGLNVCSLRFPAIQGYVKENLTWLFDLQTLDREKQKQYSHVAMEMAILIIGMEEIPTKHKK